MLDSRDDHPSTSSMGFGATTPITQSLGVSGVEANDDDGVEVVSKTQKIKKGSHKDDLKACVCIQIHLNICFCVCDYFSVWLQGNLRKINVERLQSFEFYLVLMF